MREDFGEKDFGRQTFDFQGEERLRTSDFRLPGAACQILEVRSLKSEVLFPQVTSR